MASGRSRGSLHIYDRSLYIYWFNLGQGKTALSDTCTLTPREYISAYVMHRVYTRSPADEMCFKSGSCAGNLQRNSLFYYATHAHSLSATVLCPAGYRFSMYIQCIAGHNETRSCDAVCGGVEATWLIGDYAG
jgi:hypothetical protein